MRNLDDIRLDINKTDAALKKEFLERMNLVHQVYEYKKANNLPVKNSAREEEIIRNKIADCKAFKDETAEFFKSLIEISCNYQDEMLSKPEKLTNFIPTESEDFFRGAKKVCYQGVEGAYSNKTAVKCFPNSELYSVRTFKEVFESVENGSADVGVLPVENLCAGSVYDVYDLFAKHAVYIAHCTLFEINHCVAGTGNISDVKTVLSHQMALEQCKNYIDNNGFDVRECLNTAVAAKTVAELKDSSLAAICSIDAANKFGLNIFATNVGDIANNKTKFAFITNRPLEIKGADKVSIVFKLKHESGSLARVLNNFSKHGINLTKIESRPTDDDGWKYTFFVDLDMPGFDITDYFERIQYMFESFKIIGVYNLF